MSTELTPKQLEAETIKIKLRKQQEYSDHKFIMGRANQKQPTIAGRNKRRSPSFKF